jgi:hypothetical protein
MCCYEDLVWEVSLILRLIGSRMEYLSAPMRTKQQSTLIEVQSCRRIADERRGGCHAPYLLLL